MRLIPNWKFIIRYAWSVRLILLALLLDAVAAALPFVDLPIHPAIPAVLGAMATTGALFARVVAQKRLTEQPDPLWTNGDDE